MAVYQADGEAMVGVDVSHNPSKTIIELYVWIMSY